MSPRSFNVWTHRLLVVELSVVGSAMIAVGMGWIQ